MLALCRAGFDGSPVFGNDAWVDMSYIDPSFGVAQTHELGEIYPVVRPDEHHFRSTEIRQHNRSQAVGTEKSTFREACKKRLIGHRKRPSPVRGLVKESMLAFYGHSAPAQRGDQEHHRYRSHGTLPQLPMGRSVAARHGGRNV